MDTVIQIRLWGENPEKAASQCAALLTELENTWSVTKEDSFLSRLNRGETVSLDETQKPVLEKAEALSLRTEGAFQPKLGAVIRAWGFCEDTKTVPEQKIIEAALRKEEWDLGGALKGYAGDQCAELLQKAGIQRGILNLGGNVQTFGSKPDNAPWSIGIQNPEGGEPVGTVAVLGTMAVVTSGDYQRFFEQDGVRYHHILDPETGKPADTGLRSVTVICKDGMTADCLSTALFVMGLDKGVEFWQESRDFEAVWICENGKIYATEKAAFSGAEFEVISREN